MPRVILYRDYNFQGPTKEVTTATDLRDFNDETSSIVVLEGNWQFFANYNFDELRATLIPGVYPSVDAIGIANDTLSSLRPLN
ncbi:MAG TPA: beta/gamma crystallin-related protein [Ktedonosporobacter sp.]|jgi:hypothetical protein|nr:beta/gamma crystallin-related protein [Ktedonosporobacter sp.]